MADANGPVPVPHAERVQAHGTIAIATDAFDTIDQALHAGALSPQTFVALGLDALLLIQPFFAGNPTISALIAEAIAVLEGLRPAPPA